jgi:myo-inositol 2-dehydrogenase/D-chiro-inositol 1-dehydrogenase
MNFLILGDGAEEQGWAQALVKHPEHRLWAACPGLKAFPDLPGGRDLDDALATAGIEAIIVGGEPEFRAEGLRRAAAAGLPVICLHPPGPNADPYYQIALSHQETGALVIPDLPARLHPGFRVIAGAVERNDVGAYRELRYEVPIAMRGADLAVECFPKVVDAVRGILGEIEATTATGDPPGDRPTERLVVQLRGPRGRRAEVRLVAGEYGSARLAFTGELGSMTLEHDPSFLGASRMSYGSSGAPERIEEIAAWDPHGAILHVLEEARRGERSHPDLRDGTRAMEVAEATVRSLARGRTIDLFYEEMSEEGNFKSLMTGVGCAMLLAGLAIYCLALLGRALGFGWSIYFARAIVPVLFLFLILQLFRYAIRKKT